MFVFQLFFLCSYIFLLRTFLFFFRGGNGGACMHACLGACTCNRRGVDVVPVALENVVGVYRRARARVCTKRRPQHPYQEIAESSPSPRSFFRRSTVRYALACFVRFISATCMYPSVFVVPAHSPISFRSTPEFLALTVKKTKIVLCTNQD